MPRLTRRERKIQAKRRTKAPQTTSSSAMDGRRAVGMFVTAASFCLATACTEPPPRAPIREDAAQDTFENDTDGPDTDGADAFILALGRAAARELEDDDDDDEVLVPKLERDNEPVVIESRPVEEKTISPEFIDRLRTIDTMLTQFIRDGLIDAKFIESIRFQATMQEFVRALHRHSGEAAGRMRFVAGRSLWYKGGCPTKFGCDLWTLFRNRVRRGALEDIMTEKVEERIPKRQRIAT